MKRKSFKTTILSIIATLFALTVAGQTSAIRLKIGDTAPELKVKWLKGTPVEKYENDKLYIVEFWATWCGPCKAAMPHLSELSRKYAGKVVFVGVDVWEKGYEKKTYETFFPFVNEFVKNMGEKMDYNVAMDNNDLYMSNNWMKAAGQYGVPTSFIIKEGKILWIGHPQNLDKLIDEVIAGTFKMEDYAMKANSEAQKMQDMMVALQALQKRVNDAVVAKDYTKALSIIDSAQASNDPMIINNLKFSVYIKSDVPKAIAFAKDWCNESPSVKSGIALLIVNQDSLSKEVYQLAIEFLSEYLSKPGIPISLVYKYIAECYYKMNDKPNAITSGEKALEIGTSEFKEGKYQDSVNSKTIIEFQEALEKYRGMKP